MAEKKGAKRATSKAAPGFSAEEKAAARERIREMRSQARGDLDPEAEVLAKIAGMDPTDRVMAERFHALIKAHAPHLVPRTWYGMPAYTKDGDVLCYFQDARKFKARYATVSFSDSANLDDGSMWPVVFALREMTAAEEARIVALLKKALS
jgi:uncharacterized protein YdhG (YjbR/CyaY superfamily)